MKHFIQRYIPTLIILTIFSMGTIFSVAAAQSVQMPPSDPTKDTFRLVACDGPANLNHIRPDGSLDGSKAYRRDKEDVVQFKKDFGHEPPFIACDFNGLLIQVQHLINVMLVVGVLVAVGMMTWAGALYMSGNPAKKTRAHGIFPKIGIGFILMLSAWFIVYQVLAWLTDNEGFMTLLGGNK